MDIRQFMKQTAFLIAEV